MAGSCPASPSSILGQSTDIYMENQHKSSNVRKVQQHPFHELHGSKLPMFTSLFVSSTALILVDMLYAISYADFVDYSSITSQYLPYFFAIADLACTPIGKLVLFSLICAAVARSFTLKLLIFFCLLFICLCYADSITNLGLNAYDLCCNEGASQRPVHPHVVVFSGFLVFAVTGVLAVTFQAISTPSRQITELLGFMDSHHWLFLNDDCTDLGIMLSTAVHSALRLLHR